jgi:sulfate permease, SulP family
MTTAGTDATTPSRRRNPIMQGILPIQRARIAPDVVAGITLAALGIPEVMGLVRDQ